MRTVYYDAENDRLAHLEVHPNWAPEDVRMLVLSLRLSGEPFDACDWLLAWDDQNDGPDRWRSVFFLGGDMPEGVTSQRLDALFARALAQ